MHSMRHLPRLNVLTAVLRGSWIAASVLMPGLAAAAPTGASVVAGQATISRPDGGITRIGQASPSVVINWQDFSIARGEQVVFDQPSASAAVLNRVTGGSPSSIMGRLQANGRVFLVNPQGILFGQTARVDVGSLMATTMQIADGDFLSGRYVFTSTGSTAGIAQAGIINAGDGGFVVLAADKVGNSGLIGAQLGDVVLASGRQLTLSLDAGGLIGYAVDGAALATDAGIENLGDIVASGGQVVLAAHTARDLAAAAVNHQGRISARSIDEQGGEIVLSATGGSLEVNGGLDVSGARGGRVTALADGDIGLAANTAIRAGGSQGAGGDARFIAEGELVFMRGATLDVAGTQPGAVAELSGHSGVHIRGNITVGRGGRFVLDPGGITVGNGSSAAENCSADWCEVELENLLKAGGDVEIIDSVGITFEDIVDDEINGRAAGGDGGSLFLGIGSGSGDGFAPDFEGGSVSFLGLTDQLLLDGDLTLSGGISADLGALSAGGIFLDGGGEITTGSLTVDNASDRSAVQINAAGKITVNGDITVIGHAEVLDVAAEPDFVYSAARLGLNNYASGGIEVTGLITLNGSVGSATLNTQTVHGSQLNLYAANDDITLRGALMLNGSVGSVAAPVNPYEVYGVQSSIVADFGAVHLGGSVQVNGEIGAVEGGELAIARAASFRVASYGTATSQGLNMLGEIDQVSAGGGFAAQAVYADFSSHLGNVVIAGPVLLEGEINTVEGFGFYATDAVKLVAKSNFGGVSFGQGLGVNGRLGTVSGTPGLSASGANVELIADQNLRLIGATLVDGEVEEFAFTDDSESGAGGGAIGAYLSLLTFSGSADVRGALTVLGGIGNFSAADSGFAIGAFASASSFAPFGSGTELRFRQPVVVSGNLGNVTAGAFSQATGAAFYVDAVGANVTLAGGLDVDGNIADATLGFGSDATAAYATVSSFNGAVRANADVEVTGRIDRAGGAGSLGATGATLSMRGAIPSVAGGASLSVREVRQGGSIGVFEPGDIESSTRYDGSVWLDAGQGAIGFGDITADNLYLYFNSDSSVTGSVLTSRDYLEIYTESFGPVLSGDALRISARHAFLSAHMDYGTLRVDAAEAITLYLGRLEATDLMLRTDGALTLIGGPDSATSNPAYLGATSLDVSAGSVYGDAGSRIEAEGLRMVAGDTILLEGAVNVGNGSSAASGDTGLIGRLAQEAPDLVPQAAAPNAYFAAGTVALKHLGMSGDWLQVQSNRFFLGSVQLQQPATLVHLSPLADLPFLAEGVDIRAVGLADAGNRMRTDGGRITPNVGRFDDARGENGPLAERVALSDAAAREAGALTFTVDAQPASFADLILESGLADSTIAIGGSEFAGAIQISDAYAVDVRPSGTNFVFMTRSGILGFERVLTGGQVVLLEGQLFDNPEDFYKLVAEQLATYYAGLEGPAAGAAVTEVEDEDDDNLTCE